MNDDVDECVRKKLPWNQLPSNIKQVQYKLSYPPPRIPGLSPNKPDGKNYHLLGNSHNAYEHYIFEFSIKNQLRFRGNLVRTIRRDEKKYYELLVKSSIERLMLFPYHLADMIVKGLRITPFIYYVEVVALLMELEKSYDTMPNFTAADCLRLLGIGRNEYLDLVARARSVGRRGRSRAIRALLPRVPLDVPMLPWWRVELGYVLEEDVKPLTSDERTVIDLLIDQGSQTAGTLDLNVIKSLYRRGLIYLDVPVTGVDRASVPPLKGFVMNRITGDYFETLLYKVFVSIDEHTTVAELAAMLQVECEQVKQAVSLYCRLGFANKLSPAPVHTLHYSWEYTSPSTSHLYRQITPLTFDPSLPDDMLQMEPVLIKNYPPIQEQCKESLETSGAARRVAFLFDSTLAAYLMMGNLSPDLKSHAVTLFEVGKLCDESLDSLLLELDKVAGSVEMEGEARRYLCAARCLRDALRRLRPTLRPLDLLRCEALHSLGAPARTRLLNTKYRIAISIAPLCREARVSSVVGGLPHLGPAPPEAATPWMRLYLYHVAGYGPPTLLLTKGTILRGVPRPLLGFSRLAVLWWGSDAALEAVAGGGALAAASALAAANAALSRGPVLLQALGVRVSPPLRHLHFPPPTVANAKSPEECEEARLWVRHAGLRRAARRLRLFRTCGYVTLADIGVADLGCADPPLHVQLVSPKKKSTFGNAKPISEISLSSSESTIVLNPDDTRPQSRLQSPNESHFALTPITQSHTHSPANGFTSADCGDLLQEELDTLEADTEHSKRTHSPASSAEMITNISDETLEQSKSDADMTSSLTEVMSPVDETISMFSQLSDKLAEVKDCEREELAEGGDSGVDVTQNVSDEEMCRPEKWTILDLQFGVPLFEENLCDKVCRAVADQLTTSENLEKLKEDNEYICADLLRFVSQCQYYPGEDMGIVKRGTLVPLPQRNLVFENGRISEWNGK